MKKYELMKETMEVEDPERGTVTVYRVKALQNFGNVKKEELGGFVESEMNLSQQGNCWVSHNAVVFGNAALFDDCCVKNDARVYGDAVLFDSVEVKDKARVYENVILRNHVVVSNNAVVRGGCMIYGNAKICDNSQVRGKAKVFGDVTIKDSSIIDGHAMLCDEVVVCGNAKISNNLKISGSALIEESIVPFEKPVDYDTRKFYSEDREFNKALNMAAFNASLNTDGSPIDQFSKLDKAAADLINTQSTI